MIVDIPLPATDQQEDATFWAGTLADTLLVQTCTSCAQRRFPPRPMCPHCQSLQCDWQPLSGRGRIWSFAQPSKPLLPAFEAQLPYVTALVALDEDPTLRMIGPVLHPQTQEIKGMDVQSIHIDQAVEVRFKRFDDVAMPCWLPLHSAKDNNEGAEQ